MLALVVLVLVISYASSLRAWLEQRQEISAARADIALTTARIGDLALSKQRWHDDAYIAQQARSRLGWVLPGEVGYTVLGADGSPLGDNTLSAAPPAAAPAAPADWYVALWGSITAAGQPPPGSAGKPAPPEAHTVIKPAGPRGVIGGAKSHGTKSHGTKSHGAKSHGTKPPGAKSPGARGGAPSLVGR
ncbi:MAG: FtsB family cell division protein [Nocardioidaceae bacterium]